MPRKKIGLQVLALKTDAMEPESHLKKPAFLGSMLVNLQCWIPALGFPEGNWLETKLLQISVTIDQLVQSFAGND